MCACIYKPTHRKNYMCAWIHNPPHRTDYDSIIKTNLTCFYFRDTINWLPGPLWAAVKCGYQAGAICEDATSTVWAAGRDTATQAALCHQLQLCHLSLLHHSNTGRHTGSASSTFHTRPPQTAAASGPRHMEVTCARRSRGNATNSSAWLCGETTGVLRSLNQRGHTHTPAKMRPVAGTFSAGERNRSQYLFSSFQSSLCRGNSLFSLP